MMFKCDACGKHSFKKKHQLVYRALNAVGVPEEYTMNICHKCAEGIQKYGQKHDKAEEIEIDGDE